MKLSEVKQGNLFYYEENMYIAFGLGSFYDKTICLNTDSKKMETIPNTAIVDHIESIDYDSDSWIELEVL